MFLEMAKDMPRGRAESLGRLLVPIVATIVVGLVAVGLWMAGDARRADALDDQVAEQAAQGQVVFPQGYTVPREGEHTVVVLVDGAMTDGVIRVDGDRATLLVPDADADGTLTPATDLG